MECFREAAYTQEAGPGERDGSDWWSRHLPLHVAAHAALSSPRSNLMSQTANRTTLLGQLGGAQLSGSSFPFTKSYSTILSFERTWGLLAPTPVRLPESRGLTGTAVSKGYCALDRQIYLSQPFVTLVVLASPSWWLSLLGSVSQSPRPYKALLQVSLPPEAWPMLPQWPPEPVFPLMALLLVCSEPQPLDSALSENLCISCYII